MKVLLWHVHGGWTDAFVQGAHDYLLPATSEGAPWGLGRGGRNWPANVRDVDPGSLRQAEVDVVVLQRPEEIPVCGELLGRHPGRDIPAVYLEHNTPKGNVPASLHPLADRSDIPVVHVTHFNDLFWDTGNAATVVIEHGIVDPGYLYTGERPHLGVVINEPVRRWRVTGTDLLPSFAGIAPLEVFGMGTEALSGPLGLGPADLTIRGDLPTARLHRELSGCRVYLHPLRWTSLGLALLEAMHLGMPVLALASTEAARAVPPEAGAVSTNVHDLHRAASTLILDTEEARRRGRIAREAALDRYSLAGFLAAWDRVLGDVTTRGPGRRRAPTGTVAEAPGPSTAGITEAIIAPAGLASAKQASPGLASPGERTTL
ncbi:glycosyltransferase [Arthrobacter sp. H14-L1]|uniref:glycosyltransferase n=1 Tax=Arthrobacter sp. H14-L1 TaxID=2996697 RepID=UPI00227070DF|nr:glycosyltransferase [Arthrobacter sp. H14-L1]MCY0905211.1 glycosyltransferase [Arthrobacter sp. H14-L1]